MAHNISPRKRRERLLASDADQWRTNDLMVFCTKCGRGRMMRVGTIPYRAGARLGSVVRRFRCTRCNGSINQALLFVVSEHDGMRMAFVLF